MLLIKKIYIFQGSNEKHCLVCQAWGNISSTAPRGPPVPSHIEACGPGGGRGWKTGWRLPAEVVEGMRREMELKMDRESAEVRGKKCTVTCMTVVPSRYYTVGHTYTL